MLSPMAEQAGTVILAGATGYIGRAVAAELVSRGYRVVALVRSAPGDDAPEALGHCDVRKSALTDPDALARALDGVEADAVVSCIASRNGAPDDAWQVDHGANCNLLAAARAAGAARFVLLSAICVQKPLLAFQHAKLAFERELAESGLGYAIVRPTAFFKSISGQVERVKAGKPFIVFGKGTETACKPISERDLACFIVDRVETSEPENRVLPIGGPGEALTPLDQGALLFELAGRPKRYKHVSVRLFDAVIAVVAPLSKLFRGLAAKAEFARIGRYYATESMLAWDDEHQRYDAEATPSFGTDTLRDHYARMLSEGEAGQELGEHKMF